MRFAPRSALTALLAASYVSAGQIVSRQSSSTGDSKCFETMCIQATVNGNQVDYVLSSTGKRTVGWMAIGWGRQMSGSPMVILWPNSDGSITLSQREASGHSMPTVVSSPPRVATLQESASDVTGSTPKFAFTLPVDTVATERIIWAFGTTNPGSSSPSAVIIEHYDQGQSSLDLTKSLTTSTSSGSTPSSTSGNGNGSGSGGGDSGGSNSGGTSSPLSKRERMIIAHGVICIVGFLFLLPLGALVARYFRTSTTVWFKAHQAIQSFVAGPLIIIGFSLGVGVVSDVSGIHFDSTHKRLGLALFILYIIQVIIGNLIHSFKPKSALRRRPPQNYFHAVLGILIIVTSFYQVRTGYKDEYPDVTSREALPKAADIVFYIWATVIPLLYIAGLAFLPKQYRQEAASRNKGTTYEMRNGYRGS